MPLQYLDFDYSEDADGHGSFDAMASAAPAQLAALQAEVLQVLQWAQGEFPSGPAPLDEGGDWDCELQGVQEVATALEVRYDAQAGQLHTQAGAAAAPRTTLSLTLSGTPQFCAALRQAFGL
ncbi:hypothetical protein [uncultured Ramlibacter sp.]|uniref:hypothetical protein n=1 Tax=uncultured Ramlibacter sp. TaxID=260755 RepID=UPI002635AEEF|nr:hypothetical protein [uncultured Ramlibacter sp.]